MKSVLVDFLVSAGIKPTSIVSYNHLGNNDGKNLSAPQQFRSKEISKSNVVDDMVESNRLVCVCLEWISFRPNFVFQSFWFLLSEFCTRRASILITASSSSECEATSILAFQLFRYFARVI